jgi:prophage regulatory protein
MNRKIDGDHDVPVSSPVSGITSPPRILRLKEVCKVTGLGRSCIYQLQAEKRFPRRIKIGLRAVGWLEDEVQKWLADRIADSRRKEPDLN